MRCLLAWPYLVTCETHREILLAWLRLDLLQ
jgi:hypothetical protein